MDESILNSIKRVLNIEIGQTEFDNDIIMHINSVFSIMHQIGATPKDGYAITDATQTWLDFLADVKHVNMVKSYMGMKVRLMFDPPTTSFAINAMESQIKEFEWRLNVAQWEFNPDAYHTPDELTPDEEEVEDDG